MWGGVTDAGDVFHTSNLMLRNFKRCSAAQKVYLGELVVDPTWMHHYKGLESLGERLPDKFSTASMGWFNSLGEVWVGGVK